MAVTTAAPPTAAPHRRTAPPDRRAPVLVRQGRCPMGASCGCCINSTENSHGRGKQTCRQPHPAADRKCSLPYPSEIQPCAERTTTPQHAGALPIACCIECGRVTARRWTDGDGRVMAWCAGDLPETTA